MTCGLAAGSNTPMQPGLLSVALNLGLNLEVVTMTERSLVFYRWIYQEDLICK